MEINKFEKLFFYPVAIISTVMTLMAWYYGSSELALPCSIIVTMLWVCPLYKDKYQHLTKISFWISFIALVAAAVMVLASVG